MKPILKKYKPEYASACQAIFDGLVPKYFDAQEASDLKEFLENPKGPFYVVELEEKIVGCGGFYIKEDGVTGALAWGMVDKAWHKKRLGKFLFEERVALLRKEENIESVVINTSQLTEGFYLKQGFETEEIIKDGFGPGIDQHIMRLVVS